MSNEITENHNNNDDSNNNDTNSTNKKTNEGPSYEIFLNDREGEDSYWVLDSGKALMQTSTTKNEDGQLDSKIEKPALYSFIQRLPSSEMYYRSYMHKETIQFIASSQMADFFLSMSCDGVIKFWHRTGHELEFVKKINTKDGTFVSFSISQDGKYAATGSKNGRICIFDVNSFDLINRFDFKVPDGVTVCFYHDPAVPVYQLGVTFSSNPEIIILDIFDKVDEAKTIPKNLHSISRESSKPITSMNFLNKSNGGCFICVDEDGAIEFWKNDGTQPTFEYKSTFETDLYILAAENLKAISIAVSKNGKNFAICCSDWIVRVFDTNSGKIIHKITEVDNNAYNLDNDDYDSRSIIERQYKSANSYYCVDFDDTGRIIAYPSVFGLKFISVETGELQRIIGRTEKSERFNSVCLLYIKNQMETPMALLTAFEKQRIYLFTNKPPESSKRDVVNERSEEKISKSVKVKRTAPAKLPLIATLHTTFGSIKFEMYPEECPLTVENFVTHAKRGYYDNIRFHRVVRDFCIQTGDPTGTGIGGESIWGKNFDDEIFPDSHTFDQPGMIGMANSGKNTNSSQFFITTTATPSLNGKHTCWGKVIDGMENVKKMELVQVDIHHKPKSLVKLVNITFS